MLKISRVNFNIHIYFLEHVFQPSTPKSFSMPPYMVLKGIFMSKNTNMEPRC